MRASRGKNRQANSWCDWSRQITCAWLANNAKVVGDGKEFIFVSVDRVILRSSLGVKMICYKVIYVSFYASVKTMILLRSRLLRIQSGRVEQKILENVVFLLHGTC